MSTDAPVIEQSGAAMARTSNGLAAVPRFCGALSAVLGLVVLVGWYTHNLALLRIAPAFVAMSYNAALGFCLVGLGLASVLSPKPILARAFVLVGGLYGSLVGLLTLSEYLFGLRLGIDELLMRSYVRSGITAPGRMAFCSALCFSLVGLTTLLTRGRRFPLRPALCALAGSVVIGLGLIALSGYFTGIVQSYAWGQFTRMAVHTATGFLVLGTGLIALSWLDEPAGPNEAPRWLPIPVGIGGAATTLCLWQALVVQESAQADLIRRLAAGTRQGSLGALTRAQSLLPLGELFGGLTLSLLLAGAVALAQTARRQAAQLQEARDGLERRVAERTEDLALANKSLEGVAERQRHFLRDILAAVTEGKMTLCLSPEELPPCGETSWGDPIPLTPQGGLRLLRHAALEAAAACRLPDVREQDLVTAANEAGMNAIVHAGAGTAHVFFSGGTVQVWVEDAGGGITMENLPHAALTRGFTTAGTLGHGLKMMLQTVDRLWLLTGPSGTTVVLEQDRLPPEPLWAHLGQEGMVA